VLPADEIEQRTKHVVPGMARFRTGVQLPPPPPFVSFKQFNKGQFSSLKQEVGLYFYLTRFKVVR